MLLFYSEIKIKKVREENLVGEVRYQRKIRTECTILQAVRPGLRISLCWRKTLEKIFQKDNLEKKTKKKTFSVFLTFL